MPSPHPPLTSLQEPHRHLPSARSRNPMAPLGPPSCAIVTHNPSGPTPTAPRSPRPTPGHPSLALSFPGAAASAPATRQALQNPHSFQNQGSATRAEASRPALRPCLALLPAGQRHPSLGPSHVSSPAQPPLLLPAWPRILPHHGRHVAPDVVSHQVPTGPHSSGQR